MFMILEIIRLGLKNLRRKLLRSILTALGIIFGVAAVIIMVAIGEGSTRQALEQIEALGARNIIARSQRPPETANQQGQQRSSFVNRFGMTRADLAVIRENFPDAAAIVPVKEVGSQVLRGEIRKTSQAFGTTPEFQRLANLTVARGRYINATDMDAQARVCVIGHDVARQFFSLEDPLGQTLRIDQKPFTVVGVLAPVGLAGGAGAALIGRDLNLDVHIPLATATLDFGDLVIRRTSGNMQASETQVSEIYIASATRESVEGDAARLKRILELRRPGMIDVSLIVPYELLAKARKTRLTANIVLAAVAGISLLVGGIGIMNIMLASVTERTREIGIRRAVGATRRHILLQFLVETGVLSAIGGLIGVGCGIGVSVLIGWGVPRLKLVPFLARFVPEDTSLPTHVTIWSILVAFFVAVVTGLVFGIYPAIRAAKQDPIVALRHD